MTKEEKKKLFDAIMIDVAKIVKRKINESDSYNYDVNFIQFIRKLEKITPEEIKETEKDILNAVRNMKINESVTDDAVDYILSGKSVLGTEVKYKEVLNTYEDLLKNPGKNIKELMMLEFGFFSGDIGKLYHFKEWQMFNGITTDNVPFIDFLVPESVCENLIIDMRSLGLVQRNEREGLNAFIQAANKNFSSEEKIVEKFVGWEYIRFTPMSQKNVRDVIRNNSQYIYHITDASNIDSIKKNGILLNNRSHPETEPHIFLLVPNRNDIIYRNDIQQKFKDTNLFDFNKCLYQALPLRLHQYRLDDGFITEQNPLKWKFCILTIDIDKIPNNVEFYWDIHSFPFAFFTKDNIPSYAIVNYSIENIRFII